MRILESRTEFRFKEIHIERRFLWFRWVNTYRKYRDGTILLFDGINNYKTVSIGDYCDLDNLFSTCDPFVKCKS